MALEREVQTLRDALNDEIEHLRTITVAEVGAPVMLTSMAQLEGPIEIVIAGL